MMLGMFFSISELFLALMRLVWRIFFFLLQHSTILYSCLADTRISEDKEPLTIVAQAEIERCDKPNP